MSRLRIWPRRRQRNAPEYDIIESYLRREFSDIQKYADGKPVYVASASDSSERAMHIVYERLQQSGHPNVISATFNTRSPYLHLSRYRRVTLEPAGLVLIDHTYDLDDPLKRILDNPRFFQDFNIANVFYTWSFPRAGHEMIDHPLLESFA